MDEEIKEIILSENINDLDIYLEDNYKNTISLVFDILLGYIKISKNNIEKINTIIDNIVLMVESEDNIEHLKIINAAVRNISLQMSKLRLNVSITSLKKIKFKISDINRIILNKQSTKKSNDLFDLFEYLIFEQKNVSIVEKIINDEKNLLKRKNTEGYNIFELLLERYVSLNSKDKAEINYFYHIITLFLKDENYDVILKDRSKYLTILNQSFCKEKEHVKNIINRLQDFYYIKYQELEEKYDIKFAPSIIINEEANKFKYNFYKHLDLRSLPCFTIDCHDARCLDDALSLRRNPDGTYTIYNMITDIPSFIPYQSKTNFDAYKRCETIYLLDDSITVYPPIIAYDKCSLLPNKDKCVFVYAVDVDTDYSILEDTFRISRGVINIKNRLTYEGVDHRFENLSNSELDKMLEVLALISLRLKSMNARKEEYRQIENKICLDKSHHSLYTDSSVSNNIIQEMAILTNYLIPKFMIENNYPYYFRNHIEPTEEFIRNIIINGTSNQTFLSQKRIKNLVKESYLNARYSNINQGHRGLNLPVYSHSTSPGRRYPDAIAQYLIEDIYFKGNNSDENLYSWEQIIKESSEYFNERQMRNNNFASEYNYLASKKLIRKK